MPRAPRSEQFSADEEGILHVVQRCVRRAYLAGVDAVSGNNYDHRREWIRTRMELLASVFGVDILTYSILSNHMHLVIRNRPDIVAQWSDREAAIRWLRVFPGRRLDEQLAEPTSTDVDMLVNNSERLATIRRRMSDPSWFMRALCEPIARMANKQDECTGHFWEGRFKALPIVDEASLLACSMYVDLNPIRAAMAKSPEESVHTSAYDRIAAMKGSQIPSAAANLAVIDREDAAKEIRETPVDVRRQKVRNRKQARGKRILRDGWLSPLTLDERSSATIESNPSKTGTRASDKGFLSMKLEDYLKLLDWTGRQGRLDKRGKIPADMQPILSRLGIDLSMWCDLVWNFERYFGRGSAAGKPSSLASRAANHARKWIRGQKAAAGCFAIT